MERVPARAWIMLALLGMLYALSFVDRFILALLVAPLKAELEISDVQLGLLFGTYFAIFYGLLGLPLARYADRGNRKLLIIAGVVFWSSCTVGSAFAEDYATLAVLRLGLAMGEAALTPAAFSILTDAFPRERRVLAATVFSATGMFGASASFLIGAAAIIVSESFTGTIGLSAWRLTFVAVGLPGFVLAAAFALVGREPLRQPGAEPPPVAEVASYLRQHGQLYGGLFAGAGAAQIIGYSYVAWAPALMERAFSLSAAGAGTRLSLVNIISSVGGTLIVPTVLRWIARSNQSLASWVPFAVTIAGGMLLITATRMSSVQAFLLVSTTGTFMIAGATNSVIILLQPIAPPQMRATFTALILICVSTVGLGVGPPLAAYVADRFGSERAPLADGLALVGVVGLVIGALAFTVSRRPLAEALRQIHSR